MTNSWGNDPTAETKCPNVIKINSSCHFDSFMPHLLWMIPVNDMVQINRSV